MYTFLIEMCSDGLKEQRTLGEPETFSAKPAHIVALKAKTKRALLQEGQTPLDHTPVLRLGSFSMDFMSHKTRYFRGCAIPAMDTTLCPVV